MKKYKTLFIYLGFFALLLAGYYGFVFKDFDYNASKLAVINNNISPFSFTNQDGKKITNDNTDGKVYVANYFFTTCAGICPRMNANMRQVWDKYKDEPDFMILSHTCMPETDSVPTLKKYEIKMLNGQLVKKADGTSIVKEPEGTAIAENKNWEFLTGDKQALYTIARNGYMIDDGKPDSTLLIKDQFIHTQFFALVDRQGRLRGIYDGLKKDEIQKLEKDIAALLKEKVTTKRFMTGFDNNPG